MKLLRIILIVSFLESFGVGCVMLPVFEPVMKTTNSTARKEIKKFWGEVESKIGKVEEDYKRINDALSDDIKTLEVTLKAEELANRILDEILFEVKRKQKMDFIIYEDLYK